MTGDSSRAEPEHNRRSFLSEQRQKVNLKVPIMFRTFTKVRHASVFADSYQLCYDSSTNTNPIQSIRCWSGGCCFISLCSAICGVSVISRKSAMSRPLVFCSSVALSSKMLLTRTCLHIDCSNGILYFCRWNLYSLIRPCTCCTLHFLHFCTCLAQNALTEPVFLPAFWLLPWHSNHPRRFHNCQWKSLHKVSFPSYHKHNKWTPQTL